MQHIRVGSFFSGLGAFEKALERLNIPHEIAFYCEIDKYASQSFSLIHNVPESLNLWDITKVDETKLPDFDLMTWGFPCQDISVAGKQLGVIENKTRSGLYYDGIRILRHKKPKYSIIENVKNLTSEAFRPVFYQILCDLEDAGYKSYWQVLNAKDYGVPQNRERVFIVSIRNDIEQDFDFPIGFDNGIRLKDLLEDEVDEKYYISNEKAEKLISQIKSNKKEPFGVDLTINEPQERDVANCIKARYDAGISNFKQDGTGVAIPCLTPDIEEKRQNGRRFKDDGEPMFTLTGQDRHGTLMHQTPRGNNPGGWTEREASPSITKSCWQDNNFIEHNYRIRKLTPKECFRLMDFDDANWQILVNNGISDSQLYKMAGNSIVVRVLEKIMENLFMDNAVSCTKQMALFG